MKKGFLCALISLMLVQAGFSAPVNVEDIRPVKKELDRPSVALVLAGGGAKGFAHLPIIQTIEELGIPIDMVVGTSIGSIIGGLYSAGYTPKEILNNFNTLDWTPLFSDSTYSPYEQILGEHSIFSNPIVLDFGLDFSLKLGKGISNGQKVYELLKSLSLKYPSNTDFNQLATPFRSVVVNMLNGEAMILQDGDLAEAIRASMSLPAIFEPFQMDGYHFIDGGVRYNLAINVAKKLGYDIIIAIDISQQVRDDPNAFTSNPTVAFLNTITISQATATHAMYKDASIVIHPEMGEYGTLDFMKADEIFAEGLKTAEKYRPALEELRKQIFPKDYDSDGKRISAHNKIRERGTYRHRPNLIPTDLKVTGNVPVDKNYIYDQFNKIIYDKEITPELLEDFVNGIYLTGNYVSIRPRIYDKDGETIVDLILEEKDRKGSKILMDFDLEQTVSEKSTTRFNFDAEFQTRGLTGIGSLLALRGTSLTDFGVNLFYFQPFNPYVFFSVSSTFGAENYPLITTVEYDTPSYLNFIKFVNYFDVGLRTTNGNLLKLGAAFNQAKSQSQIYTNDPTLSEIITRGFVDKYKNKELTNEELINFYNDYVKSELTTRWGTMFSAYVDYTLEKTDHSTFTHSGVYLNSKSSFSFPLVSQKLEQLIFIQKLDFLGAIPMGRNLSINLHVNGNFDFSNRLENYYLNMFTDGFNCYNRTFMPQIAYNNRFATKQALGSATIMFKPTKQLTILGGQLYYMLNGSIGKSVYEWNQFTTSCTDDTFPLLWQSNLGFGLRIKEGFNVLIRAGAGNSHTSSINPFLAVDIGNIRI